MFLAMRGRCGAGGRGFPVVYINDLIHTKLENTNYILFADDTNIFVVAKSRAEVYQNANKVLKSVQNYTFSNKLHVNAKKSCYIEFHKPRKKTWASITCY